MAKATARAKALVRSAEVRTMLIAHLNQVDSPETVAQVYEALKNKLDALKVSTVTLALQLRTMANNGLIDYVRKGKCNLYSSKQTTNAKTKVDVKIKSLKPGKVPAYKIDVVKGQKRVRITIDDVMFDIGVIDA